MVTASDCYAEVPQLNPVSFVAKACMWGKQPVTMLVVKRFAGVTLDVNYWEHTSHMPLSSVNKAAHSDFETEMRHHQKSTTGLSVVPQKNLCPSKNLRKKLLVLP